MKWTTRKGHAIAVRKAVVVAVALCVVICAAFFGTTLGTRAINTPCAPRQEPAVMGFPTKAAAEHWVDSLPHN